MEATQMPLTQKEANQLNAAKAEVKGFWILACAAEGIEPTSHFVIFSENNFAAKNHNRATGEYFKLVNRIKRNSNRRDRKAGV
jgi:hypothetical protein